MNRLFAAVILLVFATSAHALAVVGTGCAGDTNAATEYALADLSAQIQVYVESELMQRQTGGGSYSVSYNVRVTSELPIYGYHRRVYQSNGMTCADITLDERSVPFYEYEMENSIADINKFTGEADKAPADRAKTALLNQALTAYDNYDKLAAVLRILKVSYGMPRKSRAEIEADLVKLQVVSSDIAQIADNIKAQLGDKTYYVRPSMLADSVAVTPFASILAKELGSVPSPDNAQHQLNCLYDPSGDPFVLACQLENKHGESVAAAMTLVSARVCEQTGCFRSANMQALENAFNTKILPGSGFRGHFYSNYGRDSLLLTEGDVLRLYVRLSQPANIVLLGFSPDGGGYRIPVEKAVVNMPDAEVEIAAVKVVPPLGTESLVLIAYPGDVMPAIPSDIQGNADKIMSEIRAVFLRTGKSFVEEHMLITSVPLK